MEIIRKFGVVIGIVAAVLVLVIFRSAGDNFRPDAEKWAQSSWSGQNIVTPGNMEKHDNLLIINLDGNKDSFEKAVEQLNIAPASILDKQNIKRIKDHKGSVLLASSDQALSAGIWMMLSQMGMKNIYILSENDDNEALKNEFRPDTLVLPEL